MTYVSDSSRGRRDSCHNCDPRTSPSTVNSLGTPPCVHTASQVHDRHRTDTAGSRPTAQQIQGPEDNPPPSSFSSCSTSSALLEPAPSSTPEAQAEDRILTAELTWAHRPAALAAPVATLRLPKPVLIPQLVPSLTSPFARAWAPSLAAHDVRPAEFLAFLDHLNVCKQASPALEAVDVAGMAIGFVPYHWFQLAGALTQGVAGAATYGVARVRVGRYVARANEEFFRPRGLVARIVRGKKIGEVAGEEAAGTGLAGIEGEGEMIDATVRERRMRALEPWVAELEYEDLPSTKEERNVLDGMAAKVVAKNAAETHQKTAKERRKVLKDTDKAKKECDKEMEKLQRDREKVERKAAKELAKKPGKAAKVEKERLKEIKKIEKEINKEQRELEKKISEKSEKEVDRARKLMFVVVEDIATVETQTQEGRTSEL